ncbi:hypothetical protein FQA39_LY03909 [Lamprigera yunnana]|nr:hypothetical protein FQA39_LY03909 [Lamprigera yunnana]
MLKTVKLLTKANEMQVSSEQSGTESDCYEEDEMGTDMETDGAIEKQMAISNEKETDNHENEMSFSDLVQVQNTFTLTVAFKAVRMESHELTIQYGTSINNVLSDLKKISQRKPDRNQGQNRSFNFQSKQRRRDQFQSKTFPRNYQHKSQINLNSLGLENLCLHCGKSNHKSLDCFMDRKNLRHKIGHVSKVCIKSKLQYKDKFSDSTIYLQDEPIDNSDDNYLGVNNIELCVVDFFKIAPANDKYFITVTINNKPQEVEVDSGARLFAYSRK